MLGGNWDDATGDVDFKFSISIGGVTYRASGYGTIAG
jgi:hypothetical protein